VKIYLMSSPNLRGFGEYGYKSITLEEASKVLREGKFVSAIRYQWDADMLRDLLGLYIPINRNPVELEVGDAAVVIELPEVTPFGGTCQNAPGAWAC
jgi:hypothetical protein